jgi:hypothetical protein
MPRPPTTVDVRAGTARGCGRTTDSRRQPATTAGAVTRSRSPPSTHRNRNPPCPQEHWAARQPPVAAGAVSAAYPAGQTTRHRNPPSPQADRASCSTAQHATGTATRHPGRAVGRYAGRPCRSSGERGPGPRRVLPVPKRPGVAGARAGVEEAPGGDQIPVGGVSGRPPGTANGVAGRQSLGLADGHRVEHETSWPSRPTARGLRVAGRVDDRRAVTGSPLAGMA